MSKYRHQPVLLEEAVEALQIKPDGHYLDGTFGRGGHSRAVLARLVEQGRLFSLDKDPEAVAAGEELAKQESGFHIDQGDFAEIDRFVLDWGIEEGLDGILLDLGVSSPQLDNPDRGFSFMREGPLDMRMNPTQGVSAADWLSEASEREMARVFWEYGEERFARRIARSIAMTRRQKRLETTAQ